MRLLRLNLFVPNSDFLMVSFQIARLNEENYGQALKMKISIIVIDYLLQKIRLSYTKNLFEHFKPKF